MDHTVSGTPDSVFEVFNDYAGWKRWAGPPPVTLEREGETHSSGVGAVRRFAALPPVREEIVAYDPPHLMSYTLLSGAPIRNHLGTVTFSQGDTGCAVNWTAQYEPIIPGTGAVLDIVVRWFFRRILSRLDHFMNKHQS